MERNNIILLMLFGIAMLALICFLIWKNHKDKKSLNPDAPDSVEETRMDQQRNVE